GQRQIGDREHPAQTGLASEQFEHAEVESNEFHAADIGKGGTPRLRERGLTLAQRLLLAMQARAVMAAAIGNGLVRNDCIAPAWLRSIDDTIFADFGCADNVYCCA